MKNHLKIFILMLFTGISIGNLHAEYLNISPVVQVMAYKDIYGKYVESFAWGSASIINDKGVMVTNAHVVKDEKGNEIKAFAVCITKKEATKPECDYTASLINKNSDMDIAILKIDSKNIFGKDVDYTQFQHMDIDFDYQPQTQDEVVAIGYPWIGADTITQTKGIVSGIIEYNGFKYIKTDTTIEGGNSGGALVNGQKKLVGIPTFGIGYGMSLGYALLISEAKEFINQNINQSPQKNNLKIDFAGYKKTLDNVNSTGKIQDELFDVSFNTNYEVWNYIKNKYIQIKNKKQNDKLIQNLTIKVIDTPDLGKDDDFFYFLQANGIYNKDYQKLVKTDIGGMTFYTPIYVGDKSLGEADSYKIYVGRANNHSLIYIEMLANNTEENAKYIKQEIENMIKGIRFKSANPTRPDFETLSPYISINSQSGFALNDYIGTMIGYLGELHENFIIQIFVKDMYSGKGQSVKSIYETETKDISTENKSMLKLKGYEGFIYCNDNSASYIPVSVDKRGNPLNQTYCNIKIYGLKSTLDEEEYYLQITIATDKNNKEKNLDKVIMFLKNELKLQDKGNNDTDIPNIFTNQTKVNFKDIAYQSEGYKNKLGLMIKYGIIKDGEKFDPYKPLKWGEFLALYFKIVYNFDIASTGKGCKDAKCLLTNYKTNIDGKETPLIDIIKSMNIDLDTYVPVEKLDYFKTYIELKLSGANLPNFSEQYIMLYTFFYNQNFFLEQNNKVQQFNNKIYGKRKISIYEVLPMYASFWSTRTYYYGDKSGITYEDIYPQDKVNFGYKNLLSNKCLEKKTFEEYTKCSLDTESKTQILTKAYALDYMMDLSDMSFFDKSLAAKKDINITDGYEGENM